MAKKFGLGMASSGQSGTALTPASMSSGSSPPVMYPMAPVSLSLAISMIELEDDITESGLCSSLSAAEST